MLTQLGGKSGLKSELPGTGHFASSYEEAGGPWGTHPAEQILGMFSDTLMECLLPPPHAPPTACPAENHLPTTVSSSISYIKRRKGPKKWGRKNQAWWSTRGI